MRRLLRLRSDRREGYAQWGDVGQFRFCTRSIQIMNWPLPAPRWHPLHRPPSCGRPEAKEIAMSVTTLPPDFTAIKQRQHAVWSSGDYAMIGTTLQIVGERLCEAVDLRA